MVDAIFYAVWLLLHDRQFGEQHGSRFSLSLFPQGALRALVALALDQSENYRRTTSAEVLDLVLNHGFPCDRYGTTTTEMRRIYQTLDEGYAVTEETRGRIVALCLDWARQRQLGLALDESVQALEKGDAEKATEALNQARKVGSAHEPPLRLDHDLVGSLGPLSEDAVPTGLKQVDLMWHGGVRPGEFGVLLAATNIGKTMSLCFIASSAFKKNHRVLYYTFELAPNQVLRRIAAAVLMRPAGEIPIDEAPELLRQIRHQRDIDTGYIQVQSGSKTVADLLMDLEELDSEHEKPDLILLDSADDLGAKQQYQSDYQRLGEIYMDLRRLALATDVAIWTSTQATREAIDRATLSLKHMGDSFWKARRAHFVLGMSQTKSEADDPLGGLMSVFILKDSQHGTPGRAFQVRPRFGPARSGEGYPGFDIVEKVE